MSLTLQLSYLMDQKLEERCKATIRGASSKLSKLTD